ncbi:MAG: PadR family transcriptional regulator [Siculibacillus sp.]|nr:PadR family transcriptional regulator [Siculibacillus sp.]
MRSRFCGPGDDDETEDGFAGPFGGFFGRHRGGPFARRRGRRVFDSGALRLVVLGLIGEEPRHGYDLIKGLKERFQGAYAPSPGAIYPMLQLLEEAGLVTSEVHGLKRRYTITRAGRAYLEESREELDRIRAQIDEAAAPIGEVAIGEAIREFRAALYARMRRGTLGEDQARRLRAILTEAREKIEKL